MKTYRISLIIAKGLIVGQEYIEACRKASSVWDEKSGTCSITEDEVLKIRTRWPNPRRGYERVESNRERCLHRGESIRKVSISCCGGRILEDEVYNCSRHGECALNPKLASIRICPCDDYADSVK